MKSIKSNGKNWVKKCVISALIVSLAITPTSISTIASSTTTFSPIYNNSVITIDNAINNINTQTESNSIIEINSVKDLENNITNTKVDTLVINSEKKKVLESSLVREYLDDGVDVFVKGNDKDNNKNTLGYYLSSNGEEINCVSVSAMTYDGNTNLPKNVGNKLGVNTEKIIETIKSTGDEPNFEKLSKKNQTKLQAGLNAKEKYMSVKSLVYLFGNGWYDCDEGCVDTRERINNSTWFLIGSIQLECNVYNAGNTNGGRDAFDYVYSKATVTPHSGVWFDGKEYKTYTTAVKNFTLKNTILKNNSKASIVDASSLSGTYIVPQTNFGMCSCMYDVLGLPNHRKNCGTLNYTFKQNGADIKWMLSAQSSNRWEVTAPTDDAYGVPYEVAPTINVFTKKRKKTTIVLRINVPTAVFMSKGYWIGQKSLFKQTRVFRFTKENNKHHITIKFRNHKSKGVKGISNGYTVLS